METAGNPLRCGNWSLRFAQNDTVPHLDGGLGFETAAGGLM